MSTAKLRIKKGDKVIVTTGKDKGKTGEVIRTLPAKLRVVVRGINLQKKHSRPSAAGAGGINEQEAPIAISNVAIADPKTGEATRIGYKILDNGKKVRFAKKSGEMIDN